MKNYKDLWVELDFNKDKFENSVRAIKEIDNNYIVWGNYIEGENGEADNTIYKIAVNNYE